MLLALAFAEAAAAWAFLFFSSSSFGSIAPFIALHAQPFPSF
jgi:hypothetical protein